MFVERDEKTLEWGVPLLALDFHNYVTSEDCTDIIFQVTEH